LRSWRGEERSRPLAPLTTNALAITEERERLSWEKEKEEEEKEEDSL